MILLVMLGSYGALIGTLYSVEYVLKIVTPHCPVCDGPMGKNDKVCQECMKLPSVPTIHFEG